MGSAPPSLVLSPARRSQQQVRLRPLGQAKPQQHPRGLKVFECVAEYPDTASAVVIIKTYKLLSS